MKKLWNVMLACLCLVGVMVAQPLHGQAPVYSPTIRWTPPTARMDGTALDPDTELAEYRAECSRDQTFATFIFIEFPNAPGLSSYVWQDAFDTFGRWYCRLMVRDTDSLASDWSNVASVVVNARPNPPDFTSIERGPRY